MAFRVMGVLLSGILLAASLLAMTSCANESELAESIAAENPSVPNRPSATEAPPVYSYRVVRSYPHDRRAFTQGLVYEAGELYEGTGIRGQSSVRRVEIETGTVRQQHVLPR